MQMIARVEYSTLKDQYLGGSGKEATKKFLKRFRADGKDVNIAFYMIELLSVIARDRESEYEDRIHAVDCLKAMH